MNGKRLFKCILADVIYPFTCLIPKNNKLWVFGAWKGEKYADNSKSLFEYVNENHPEIRAVWLTNNKYTLELVKKKGYEAALINSPKSYILSLRARIGVMTNGMVDINPYASGRMKIIQLWHGFPNKKFLYDSENSLKRNYNIHLEKVFYTIFPNFQKDFRNDSLHFTSSEKGQERISLRFRIPPERVKITGFPRLDNIILAKERVPLTDFLGETQEKGKFIGIYAPTHIDGQTKISTFLLDNLTYIQERLADLNVILLIKLHFTDQYELNSFISKTFDNIIFLKDSDINQDIYTILKFTDFLITDYSSICFDYLLLDKPVILFQPNHKDKLKNIELYSNIELNPKTSNWVGVLNHIEESINYPDKYKKERFKLRKICHKYSDTKSCERVYNEIIKDIKSSS